MNLEKQDPIFPCFSVNAAEELQSAREYNNLLTWKFATLRLPDTTLNKNCHYFLVNGSKYLCYGLILSNNPTIYGVFDLHSEVGCVVDHLFIDISKVEFACFKAQSVSEINSLIFNGTSGGKTFDDRSFEMLKELSKVRENQAKSPDELAIKAIKLALAFDTHLASAKAMFQ